MLKDSEVMLLIACVTVIVTIALAAYGYLLRGLHAAIRSNDGLLESNSGLKSEITRARSEISALQAELEKSSVEKEQLRQALSQCLADKHREG